MRINLMHIIFSLVLAAIIQTMSVAQAAAKDCRVIECNIVWTIFAKINEIVSSVDS